MTRKEIAEALKTKIEIAERNEAWCKEDADKISVAFWNGRIEALKEVKKMLR